MLCSRAETRTRGARHARAGPLGDQGARPRRGRAAGEPWRLSACTARRSPSTWPTWCPTRTPSSTSSSASGWGRCGGLACGGVLIPAERGAWCAAATTTSCTLTTPCPPPPPRATPARRWCTPSTIASARRRDWESKSAPASIVSTNDITSSTSLSPRRRCLIGPCGHPTRRAPPVPRRPRRPAPSPPPTSARVVSADVHTPIVACYPLLPQGAVRCGVCASLTPRTIPQ
jgi:hypothetical protein